MKPVTLAQFCASKGIPLFHVSDDEELPPRCQNHSSLYRYFNKETNPKNEPTASAGVHPSKIQMRASEEQKSHRALPFSYAKNVAN